MSGRAHLSELIDRAVSAKDDDTYWQHVREMQEVGTRGMFDAAARLLQSDLSAERRLGTDVLGQLGSSEGRPFLEHTLPLLLAMSEHETDPDVVAAVVSALGHQDDVRGIPGILRQLAHPSAEVRRSVASSLHLIGEVSAVRFREEILPALGTLMTDPTPTVRDWATFTLAHHAVDGTDLRHRLFAMVSDADERVRGEAIRGLARRHDRRATVLLREELDRAPTIEDLGYKIADASELMASSELLPLLVALRDRSPASTVLDRAIANCDPEQVQRRIVTLNELLDALVRAGIDATISQDLFDPAAVEDVIDVVGVGSYQVDSLLQRSGGSVQEAARLINEDRAKVDDT